MKRPLLLSVVLLAAAACGAEPTPASRPPSAKPASRKVAPATVQALMAQGEFLAARRRALAEGNTRTVRMIEARAGVRGRPSEDVILERIAVYEVVNHFSAGERLFQEGNRAAAAAHLERGLQEIEVYTLQRRFPAALRNRIQGLLEEARR